MWNSRSPGVDGALCGCPMIGANGFSSRGLFPGWSRSHRSLPIPAMQDRRAERSRNPTVLTRSSSPPRTEGTEPALVIADTLKVDA